MSDSASSRNAIDPSFARRTQTIDLRFTKPLPDSVNGGIERSYDKSLSDTSNTPSNSDATLRQLVQAWPDLPASVRDCIVTIVTTVTEGS